MIIRVIAIVILISLPVSLRSQSLDISTADNSRANSSSTFNLADGKITISSTGSVIEFQSSQRVSGIKSFGISPDKRFIAVASGSMSDERVFIFSSAGDTLYSYDSIPLDSADPSLALYPLGNGDLIIRNNIANITYHNSFGKIVSSASASSESQEGESISEVLSDYSGNTILVYTPKIKVGNNLGSQAQLFGHDNSLKNIFSSNKRTITNANMSDNGSLILLITKGTGTADRVYVFDRFGNSINEIESDEDLTGALFSGNGDYVTMFSSRRILVYNILTGERVGSTSFRSTVLLAAYFPQDGNIIGLTGDFSEPTGLVNDVEFHVINLEKRKVVREEFTPGFGVSGKIPLLFSREAPAVYRLQGTSKLVEIRPGF